MDDRDFVVTDAFLGWTITAIGVVFLARCLPHVSWFTPGSADRLWAVFVALLVGVTYLGFQLRIWRLAVGGLFVWWFLVARVPGG